MVGSSGREHQANALEGKMEMSLAFGIFYSESFELSERFMRRTVIKQVADVMKAKANATTVQNDHH